MTLSVRRSVAVLAIGAALGSAGCGSSTANRAAVVDGTVITETDLQAAMAEINSMDPALLQEPLTPTGTLTALVQAPVVLGYLAEKGLVVSDSVAASDASTRGVRDAHPSTLKIIQLASVIATAQQTGQITETDGIALTEQLQALDVEVNPRYGTFDPASASIALGQPDWIATPDPAQ